MRLADYEDCGKIKTGKDLLYMKEGDSVSDLSDIIQKSKIRDSENWAGEEYIIHSTPQKGINWIGDDSKPSAVILKTTGKYEEKPGKTYALEANKGKVNEKIKANQVILNQKTYNYPLLYFVRKGSSGSEYILHGKYSVNEICPDEKCPKYVTLAPFDDKLIIGNMEESEIQKRSEAAKTLGINLKIIEALKIVEETGVDINVFLKELNKVKQGIVPEETDDVFDPDIENNNEPFPEDSIKDLHRLRVLIKQKYSDASEVKYEYLLRHIRTSRGKDRDHIGYRYRGHCQICQSRNPYWEVAEIFENPKKELEQMNLSLCPNCASEYHQWRKDENLMSSFKTNICNANPEKDTIVMLGEKEVKFTNTHLAEIQEILKIEKE